MVYTCAAEVRQQLCMLLPLVERAPTFPADVSWKHFSDSCIVTTIDNWSAGFRFTLKTNNPLWSLMQLFCCFLHKGLLIDDDSDEWSCIFIISLRLKSFLL